MSEALYHAALVDRARTAFGKGRLPDADASATVDNPLCGDRVTLDLKITDGKITAIGHDVRGCLLCEASAATIAARKAIEFGLATISRSRSSFGSESAGTRAPANPVRREACSRSPLRHDP